MRSRRRQRSGAEWESLTDAELRVAALVAEGLTYREIAERLSVSVRTVETHVAREHAGPAAYQARLVRPRSCVRQESTRRPSKWISMMNLWHPKRRCTRAWLSAACVLVSAAHALPAPALRADATSVEAHVDVRPYAIIILPVEYADVAPYLPAGFQSVDAGGETILAVSSGIWENFAADVGGGTIRRDAPFAQSQVAIATAGPEGQTDSGGVLDLWRLAGAPAFPRALGRLGVGCDRNLPAQTPVCHVPALNATTTATAGTTTVDVTVPWRPSPYSASATFAPAVLPCAFCALPIAGWHVGSRGRVRESPMWAFFPETAITGVGTGVVRAAPGSPLYHILGERTEVTGIAVLLSGHVDAEFKLE